MHLCQSRMKVRINDKKAYKQIKSLCCLAEPQSDVCIMGLRSISATKGATTKGAGITLVVVEMNPIEANDNSTNNNM